MKSIIATVIISAGICIPLSYLAGTLLTRSDRLRYESQVTDLKNKNQMLLETTKHVQTVKSELEKISAENEKLKSDLKFSQIRYEAAEEQIKSLSIEIATEYVKIYDRKKENNYNCDVFRFFEISLYTGSDVTITGIVQNNDDINYSSVSFDVSYYDRSGIVLGTSSLSISSFKKGQKRAFSDTSNIIHPRDIAGYRIDISSKYHENS